MPFRIFALEADRPIPLEAVTLERRQNFFDRTFLLPWRIDILDAQEPAPAPGPGLQITCGRREKRAEMQRSRGRRREPADVLCWHRLGHVEKKQVPGSAVSIIPIAELALGQFAALLGLDAECRNGTGLESLEADFLASLIAEAIAAFLNAHKCGVNLAQ